MLGPKRGLDLVEATPGAAGIIVRQPADNVEVYGSRRLKELRMEAAADGPRAR